MRCWVLVYVLCSLWRQLFGKVHHTHIHTMQTDRTSGKLLDTIFEEISTEPTFMVLQSSWMCNAKRCLNWTWASGFVTASAWGLLWLYRWALLWAVFYWQKNSATWDFRKHHLFSSKVEICPKAWRGHMVNVLGPWWIFSGSFRMYPTDGSQIQLMDLNGPWWIIRHGWRKILVDILQNPPRLCNIETSKWEDVYNLFCFSWCYCRWFQTCFIFTPYLGKIPILTHIFSKGLKPPTRSAWKFWFIILFVFTKFVVVKSYDFPQGNAVRTGCHSSSTKWGE